jgi:hypothetical protein
VSITVTWDSAFRADPEGSDDPRQGDDSIRQFKVAVEERIAREHIGLYTDTNANHGMHRQGSAVAFCQAAAPTTSVDGGSLSATLDLGRLWVKSTTGHIYYYNGSAFAACMEYMYRASVQGVLITGSSVVPPIHFSRAATISKVSIRVGTAPTGTTLIVDLLKNGSSSLFSGVTKPTIAISGFTNSVTSFHATNKILADDDYLTLDISQVGSTIAGADLSVTIVGG